MNFDPIRTLGSGRDDAEESTDQTTAGRGSVRRRLTLAAAGLGAVVLVRRWRARGSADADDVPPDKDANDVPPDEDADDIPPDEGDDARDADDDSSPGGGIRRTLGGVVASAVLAVLVRKAIRRREDGATN